MATKINGFTVGYTVAGAIVLWSGIEGATISSTARSIMSGKTSLSKTEPITGSSASADSGSSASGSPGNTSSPIANDALKYVGHAYVFGGAPGTDGSHPWDCSSMCNWVLGHDFGLAIPGVGAGKYTGATHGPPTTAYLLAWQKYSVGHSASVAQAGDLCVWETHMGIATGGGDIVSALNESLGTKQTTISAAAPPGEPVTVIRVPGALTGGE
jgi:cell wall-associated NlpC family hydrolase